MFLVALCLAARMAGAATPAGFDAARAFGALPSAQDLSLSPDGSRVALLMPDGAQATVLVTAKVAGDAKDMTLKAILRSDGKPFRLTHCTWVANDRLVCRMFGIIPDSSGNVSLLPVSRQLALDADGGNVQWLATQRGNYSRDYLLSDGEIIDLLPGDDGAVLMSRRYTPDSHTGSHIGSDAVGLGVDRIDTRTLKAKRVVAARPDAMEYLSDGRGNVRVMAVAQREGGYDTGVLTYFYRPVGDTEWKQLSEYNQTNGSGFLPVAVDYDRNIAFGLRRNNGRDALYSIKLDASLREELAFAHPDVDIAEVIQIGRRQRVVGASFVTDRREAKIFEPEMAKLIASLSRALPHQPLLRVTDSSVDESKLVILGSSDVDPGVYYLFDRAASRLETFLVVRDQLEGVELAKVKPVMYPSDDGVQVPGYLTLPPGVDDARGLPAIVLPHGGPSARDEWGFDWLSQYFANRGYAVLQPNFRGSAGYGDAWFEENGFRSWRTAVGDVLAAGRWLVKEGIADPKRLGVVGWSYGGYAALQSAVVDPAVFKAVVAIAPVTDFEAVVSEARNWSNYDMVRNLIGDGPHVREGSPIAHADKFKAPVLLFHGTMDRNVGYKQSERMAAKLKDAGARAELVTFDGLDHQLLNSEARAGMLRRSDEFLRAAFN